MSIIKIQTGKYLSGRIRELFLNGTWIANTNYRDQLMKTSWEEAVKKRHGFNSVAMLTFHINYYLNGLIEVFEGGRLNIHDKYSFDMPDIADPKGWEVMRKKLFNNAEKFASHVEQMKEEDLENVFVDEKYGTWMRNIEAVIEHGYYHLGQIVVIRKMSTV